LKDAFLPVIEHYYGDTLPVEPPLIAIGRDENNLDIGRICRTRSAFLAVLNDLEQLHAARVGREGFGR
jgi:hypothetical protein